jgi:membrane-anchored glycerophosphoryl diester phosphodiesterase (GDPDase)
MMKKITRSRWAIVAFVLVLVFVVMSTSGCSVLQTKYLQMTGQQQIECKTTGEKGCEGFIKAE